jgi:hypothetical protein
MLDAVFARQKKILNNQALTEAEKDAAAPFLVLLDDVISDERLKYDRNIMLSMRLSSSDLPCLRSSPSLLCDCRNYSSWVAITVSSCSSRRNTPKPSRLRFVATR